MDRKNTIKSEKTRGWMVFFLSFNQLCTPLSSHLLTEVVNQRPFSDFNSNG
jgi:hypothetical protein